MRAIDIDEILMIQGFGCLSSLSMLRLFYKTFIKILFGQLKERNGVVKAIFL